MEMSNNRKAAVRKIQFHPLSKPSVIRQIEKAIKKVRENSNGPSTPVKRK